MNWEHGMLLTPDHFLRQERYFEASLLWALRYVTNVYGLVGGGPRLAEAERGAVKYDPVVSIDEDDQSLGIAVTQCRALTPAGCMIEIDPGYPLQRRFQKSELEGVAESLVYIVCDPQEKQVLDGSLDEFNPQMKTERRPAYRLTLQVHADSAAYGAAVARIRRQRYGAGYEKDAAYIPPCATLVAHSELTNAWRNIIDDVTLMTERHTELHRAMREFLVLFTERGIETEVDEEAVAFVDRMVVALEACAFDILDPVQSPQQFFAKLRRLFHCAAAYLDLTPAVQQYFDTLKETGETEFIAIIEQQKRILRTTRSWGIHDDLSAEVREARGCLQSLQRLERALEGKYIDFHVSPSLEAMNFVFDRGGKVLYKLAAKPARVQGVGDELTLYFSQLRLEGRDKYRLILIGEQNATFEKGTKIPVEIRINEGSGFRRQPIVLACESKLPEQLNFEYDFEAPDVPTITDIRVTLQAHYPIRTALLYIRHRFYAQRAAEPARAVEPLQPEPRVAPAPVAPPDLPRTVRPDPAPPPLPRVDPGRDAKPAPWDAPRRAETPPRDPYPRDPGDAQPPPPAPRRRRLE
ncbi:MAG TPA: type VI secretion system baseplate subunit TssK [Bryobacteraceae bacterium]|nr:type VI secretion system baseplate subunit TssK [Bryobacteraceae bacterium]